MTRIQQKEENINSNNYNDDDNDDDAVCVCVRVCCVQCCRSVSVWLRQGLLQIYLHAALRQRDDVCRAGFGFLFPCFCSDYVFFASTC